MARTNKTKTAKTPRLSSKKVMKEFGLTEKQFRSEYEVFRRRVQNFNKITGFKYSALKEYRYSKLYPNNATIQAIKDVTSAPSPNLQRAIKPAQEYSLGRFRGLINSSIKLQNYEKQLKQGKITLAEFNKKAVEIGKYLAEKREKYPAVAGSEEIISGTFLSNNLVQENQQISRDPIFS